MQIVWSISWIIISTIKDIAAKHINSVYILNKLISRNESTPSLYEHFHCLKAYHFCAICSTKQNAKHFSIWHRSGRQIRSRGQFYWLKQCCFGSKQHITSTLFRKLNCRIKMTLNSLQSSWLLSFVSKVLVYINSILLKCQWKCLWSITKHQVYKASLHVYSYSW